MITMRIFVLLLIIVSPLSLAERFVVASQNLSYYPHYDFRSPSNKGYGWALLEAYAKESGHSFEYIAMPVLRLQRELLKGSVDLIYPDHPKWTNPVSKASQKHFSLPVVTTLAGTWVKPEQYLQPIDNIKKLGIPYGFSPRYWEQRINAGKLTLVGTNDSISALKLVEMGRVEAADCDYHVAKHLLALHPDLGPMKFDPTLPSKPVDFHLSTVHQVKLIEDINQFVLQHPALIARLKQQYGITDPTQTLLSIKQSIR